MYEETLFVSFHSKKGTHTLPKYKWEKEKRRWSEHISTVSTRTRGDSKINTEHVTKKLTMKIPTDSSPN